MNPYTGYKDVLLYHDVGTGKSGTMIAVMEDYMEVEGYGKPLILVKWGYTTSEHKGRNNKIFEFQ